MNELAIEVRDLSKAYGAVQALDSFTFEVRKGEIFGLIGADGAGKTTLFRILTTLLLPDKGSALIEGKDVVKDYRGIRESIGYMPGKFSLYQDLTVEENLNFFATIFNTTIHENYHLIEDIYKMLEPFKTRRAGKLSGGMKQKLALSCALIHKPSVLFLDEPTTGVDPVSRKEFWEMLHRLKMQGITIIVSTAYMDEAAKCDRLALMHEGRMISLDTPEKVISLFTKNQRVINTGKSETEITEHENTGKETDIEYAITVRDLTKRFGDFTAVDSISFNVKKGEIFGFLGANGAGKTTAMRMLCGLWKPTSGEVKVAGFDVYTQTEKIKSHIGYMSQKFSLYEDLTVLENISFYGGIYHLSSSEIKRKSEQIVQRLNLTDQANNLVSSLPPGWKQKLAFSVSILHQPDIVFLDEPTGGVDPLTRRQFWEMIYEAAHEGITVFVTTHYLDEAEYCDRLSIMVDGRIAALGTPSDLKKQFSTQSMDEIFVKLARGARRTLDV